MGWLVFSLHHTIGYEKAYGYPEIGESFRWALGLASPILFAAIFAGHGEGVERVLRWLCVLALGGEVVLLGITWLSPYLALLPGGAAVLLVYSEWAEQLAARARQRRAGEPWSRRYLRRAAVTGLVALGVWWGWFRNPLPSDEEMIAHFQAHRAEFEELVELFRNYRPQPADSPAWDDIPEIRVRRERIGVRYVTPQLGYWLPDPYSVETGKHVLELILSHQFGQFEVRRYSTLKLVPADKRYYRGSVRYGTIWKDYHHFPETPKVEDGRLWWPANEKGEMNDKDRVFSSLNGYPPNWEKGDCVYRRIELHWFIRMCRAF